MNTNSAMRTVLAAAAAGALVLGSAGAATAHPKSPKAKGKPAGDVTITKVDIKRHKKVNLDAPYGDLALRVKVRDTSTAANAEGGATLTLGLFAKKKDKDPLAEYGGWSDTAMSTAAPKVKESKSGKKWVTYTMTFTQDQFKAMEEAIEAGPEGFKAKLCITAVSVTTDPADTEVMHSKQTQRRLGEAKKTVRECVTVYDMDDQVPTPEPAA